MWIVTEFMDFFQPTIQPTTYDVLHDFRVLGSPRGLVSCKTYSCCSDKGEVGGSSPPRPTKNKFFQSSVVSLQFGTSRSLGSGVSID